MAITYRVNLQPKPINNNHSLTDVIWASLSVKISSITDFNGVLKEYIHKRKEWNRKKLYFVAPLFGIYGVIKTKTMAKNNETMFKLEDKIESSVSKIDVIKNLILGETLQNYDAEFEVLKKDILNKKQVLEDLIEEIKADLHNSIDSVTADLDVRINDLENNLENKLDKLEKGAVDKKLLGKLLMELGEKISSK